MASAAVFPARNRSLVFSSHHFRLSAAGASGRQSPSDSLDLSADLLPELSGSGVRADLRQFLTRLLVLVTQGRVTPRRLPFSLTSPTNSFTLTALHFENTSRDAELQIVINL